MDKASDKNHNKSDIKSEQEIRNNFWHSIALLVGNIGMIIKILIEVVTDRKK